MFASAIQFFSPLTQVFLRIFSPIDAYHAVFFITLVLALFFMFEFLIALDLGVLAPLIGGIAFFIAELHYLDTTMSAAGTLILPLLFLIIWRVNKKVQSGEGWVGYLLAGSATIAFGFVSGTTYWQPFYALVAALGFTLYLGIRKKSWKKLILFFILINFIGGLVGLIQLIPTFILTQSSGRSGGLSYQEGLSGGGGGLQPIDLLRFFYPLQGGGDAYVYMGLIPFLFMAASFFRKDKTLRFFKWLFIIALLTSFHYSPLFWFFQHLPIFSFFRGPSRFMFIGSFAAATMAAFGAQHFLAKIKNQKWFLILIILLIIDFAINFSAVFKEFPRALVEKLPESVRMFKKLPPGIVFSPLADNYRFFVYAFGPKSPLPDKPNEELLFDLESFHPNLNLLYGIPSSELYDSLIPFNVARLLGWIGARQINIDLAEKLTKHDITPNELIHLLFNKRKPLLDFLGIKYIFSGFKLEAYDVSLPQTGEFVQFDFMAVNINGKKHIPRALLYINPEAKPAVYFSEKVIFSQNEELAFNSWRDNGFKDTFVVCPSCQSETFRVGDGEITIKEKENSFIKLAVNSNEKQFLVFSQNFLPGWKALIDDSEVPIYSVNTVFMGIFVPAGTHEVEFVYNPWDLFKPSSFLK